MGLAYRRVLAYLPVWVDPPELECLLVLAYRPELECLLVLAYRRVAGSIRPVEWCRLRGVVVM